MKQEKKIMDAGIGLSGYSKGKDEYASDSFNLFANNELENGIQTVSSIVIRPVNTYNSKGPIIFEAAPDPVKFTDAESFRLHGRMKITKHDGTALTTQKVGPVNNIFHSLWSKVTVKINDVEIGDSTSSWYAYKAYLENHLSYSKSAKEKILSYKGYLSDTAEQFDDVGSETAGTYTASTNTGLVNRIKMFEESKWVYFCININSDITTLRKYLPPNTKFEIQYERMADEFCLLSHDAATKFAIVLDDMRMSFKRYTPSRSVSEYINNEMRRGQIPTLPIDRSLIKQYTVGTGSTDLSHFNLIRGDQLPEQIIIGVVEQSAYNGNIKMNPFNFQHFNIREASLIVNGVNEPTELYKLDTTSGDKADMFANFIENTGVSVDDREFGISLEDYYGGSFLLAWDRTPDKCNRFHRHAMDSGSIDINIKLGSALNKPVSVIVYATYSSDIKINNQKVEIKKF